MAKFRKVVRNSSIEREGDGSKYIGNDDKLSQLPQHILHHILSLLSQDEAAQTSLLSKSWRHLWYGRPTVEFCESEFTNKETTFLYAVDNTLQRYLDQRLPLKELCLEISENETSVRLLEKWVPAVMLRSLGVQELELSFLSKTLQYCDMPFSVISKSEALKDLHLEGYNLASPTIDDKLHCRHLLKLCLMRVHIGEETFEKIMTSCPSIERVCLLNCKGFKTIKLINNKHLKVFFLIDLQKDDDDDYCRIDFDAPNIESILILGCSNLFYRHNYFPYLIKSLILKKVKLSTNSLDIFSSNFPCLEELILSDTYGYEQFRLSSRSIRTLIVRCLRESIKVITFDAPNILYFNFACISLPSSFSFATTSAGHNWKSCISVNWTNDHGSSSWLTNLTKLLKAVSQSRISLDLHYNPLLDISYGDGYNIEGVIKLEHLILTQILSSNSIPDSFLNFVFRIFRPRYTFSVDSERENNDLGTNKSLYERLVHGGSNSSDQNYWQRDLEQASIEASEDNGEQWYPVLGLPECALSTGQKIRFRLTWRES